MPLILDHLIPLELDDEARDAHFNELKSLDYLVSGLDWLARGVHQIETRVLSGLDATKRHVIIGNAPELAEVPQGILACALHWYAVSACNYVRLVGWLAKGQDPQAAANYVRDVLPNVIVWRNKVTAHFAIADPLPEDTPADLAASVIFPIGFQFQVDSFVANPLTIAFGGPSGGSTSRADLSWSLTKTHLDLCKRFWPEQAVSGSQS